MNSPASLETILSEHGPFLRRLARALVADSHVAEDLVQDTWKAVLTSPTSVPPSKGRARAWLSTVLRQVSYSHFRRAAIRNHGELAPDHPAAADGSSLMTERLERDRIVQQALLKLQEPYRSVLVLKFHDGLSNQEIAEDRDANESTIRSQLARGVKRLRESLDVAYGDSDDPRATWLAAFAPLLTPSASPTIQTTHTPNALTSTKPRRHYGLTPSAASIAPYLIAAAVIASAVVGSVLVMRGPSTTGETSLAEAQAVPGGQVRTMDAKRDASREPGPSAPLDLAEPRVSVPAKSPPIQSSAQATQLANGSSGRSMALTGTLRLADGTPLGDRAVSARPTGGGERTVARTNELGQFRFTDLAEEPYDLSVATTLEMDGTRLESVPSHAASADFVLDAILLHVVFPKSLRHPTRDGNISIQCSRDGLEEGMPSVGQSNVGPDADGQRTLLLPTGFDISVTYRSRDFDLHGLLIDESLTSGVYERTLRDSHPAYGSVNVVVLGDLTPDDSTVSVSLQPLTSPGQRSGYLPVHASRRSARTGFMDPGEYSVTASLNGALLERWQRVTWTPRTFRMEAGDAVTIEVTVEPAGGLKLLMEPAPGIPRPLESDRYASLIAEAKDPDTGEWRPLSLAKRIPNPGSPITQWRTGESLLPGEARFNWTPLPPGPLEVRLTGEGWRTSATTLQIIPGERTLWSPRPESLQ